MATLGPHRPKKGWALRWTRQAVALCVAAPMAFLMLAAAVAVLGSLGLVAHRIMGGSIGTAVSAALVALAILPAGLVSNLLLAADGRGRRSLAEMVVVVRPLLLPVFGLALAQGLLATLAGAAGATALTGLTEIEAVVALGLGAYLGAATILAVLNVFWLGSCAALGLEAAEAWSLQEVIAKREGGVFLAMLLVTLIVGNVLLAAQPILGLLALLVFQAWNYVAGREVLGGIDENGTPEGAANLQPMQA